MGQYFFNFLNIFIPTFLSVLLILYFRRSDRRNTQLQTLNNFVKQTTAQMQKIFSDKEKEFLDKTINLDISLKKLEKASSFINTRMDEMRAGLVQGSEIHKSLKDSINTANDFNREVFKVKERLDGLTALAGEMDTIRKELSETRKSTQQLKGDMEQSRVWSRDSVAEFTRKATEELGAHKNELSGEVQKFKSSLSASMNEWSGRWNETIRKFNDSQKLVSDRSTAIEKQLTEIESGLTARAGRIEQEIKATLSEKLSGMDAQISESLKTTQAELEKKRAATMERMEALIGNMNEQFERINSQQKEEFGDINAKFDKLTRDMQAVEDRVKEEAERIFEKASRQIETDVSELRREAEKLTRDKMDSVGDTVTSEVQKFEERFVSGLKTLENRLNMAQNSLKAMESEFTENLEGQTDRFKNDILELKKDLVSDTELFLKKMEEKEKDIARRAEEAQKELSGLSGQIGRVRDDIDSAKLRTESALSDMQDTLDERIKTFGRELDNRLDKVGRELEGTVNEKKASLVSMMNDLLSQTNEKELVRRIEKMDAAIAEAVEQARTDIEGREKVLASEWEAHFKEAARKNTADIEALKNELEKSVRETSRLTEGRLQETQARMNEIIKNLDGVLTRMQNGEEKLSERIDVLVKDFARKTDEYKTDFSMRMTEEIQKAQSEYQKVASRITEMDKSVRAVEDRAVDAIKSKVRVIEDEMNKKVAGISNDFERYFQKTADEFKSQLELSRNDVDSIMNELKTGKIAFKEEIMNDIKELGKRTRDIETRYDSLMKKSLVLERAENLADRAGKNIDSMNSYLKEIEARKGDLEEALQTLSIVRGEHKELMAILNLIQTNRKEATLIHQTVTQALEKARETDDLLAQIQKQEGKVDDLKKLLIDTLKVYEEITVRVAEVETKREVVNRMLVNIEKSSENTRDINDKLIAADDKISMINKMTRKIEEDVKTAQINMNRLFQSQEKVTEAYDKIGDIENLMAHIDEEYKKVQKMRDWVARTQNTLERLQESQESISGTKPARGRDSAKNDDEENVRNIIKLKEQGWSDDEIARSLKISRAYVELIIERYADE